MGYTALMWAGESLEMVKLLIQKEFGLQDLGGYTALMWALKHC